MGEKHNDFLSLNQTKLSMRNLITLILFLCLGCKSTTVEVSEVKKVESHDARSIISYLASDELSGRSTGSDGIEKAASYIEKRFMEVEIKPYFSTYRDAFDAKDKKGFNIVGYLEGTDPNLKEEVIIIGAHYDHIGIGRSVDNDSIANGANDNATGTAAVLLIADHFARSRSNKRSLLFALFSAEEMGLLGSKHLAQKLKDQNLNLYTMVNFEMLGVPLIEKDHKAFVSGYDLSNMAQKLNDYTGTDLIGKSEVAVKYNLFKRSDNYPFYNVFKKPCQTISSCDLTNFDFYHHVDDEIDKMDFNFMADFINELIPGIEKMSSTTSKEIVMHE